MRIDIQGRGFPLTAAVLDHTEQQLRFALTRTSGRIKRVEVRLGRVDGARDDPDRFCRIQVFLNHAPPVQIEDTGPDLYALIDRVSERAGRNVARRIERTQGGVRPALGSAPAAMFDAFRN